MRSATVIPRRHEVDSDSFLLDQSSEDDSIGDCGKSKDACTESANLCGLDVKTVFACFKDPGQCPQENC
ncbi:hypothetical protein BMS3Abin15_00585 [bacterium BMS3Abin15]|nr:hypothetical protein BMS3Abin15_00585 [bacterium BMS3Abin15]HDZ85280.1 hypothetical protein [Candidatus Moranbacteria bacterium]